jgi:hypothetical protein
LAATRDNETTPRDSHKAAMQIRAKWLALLTLIVLTACGTTRRSAAELDTSRQEPAQAPAPQYPYTWRPRQLPREPACYDAAMCYDEKREVCVLHGGRSWWWDSRDSTWIWDGEKWWCEQGSLHSTFAHSHAMTYRHETEGPVMWGGGLDCVYTMWNHWSPLTDNPIERSPDCIAMASDPLRQVVVAFGGLGADRKELRTLYEIHGEKWKPVTFESGPDAQYNALFIYEPTMKACMLVDRVPAGDGASIRTWTWDGEKWSADATKGPQATISRAQFLLYDTDRLCAVAVCPTGKDDIYELWELKGHDWIRRESIGAPTCRPGCCATYDQKRKAIVLHGGEEHLSDVFACDETWLCGNDGVWRCANSPPAPRPDVNYSCMCYDPSRRVTVMLEETVNYFSNPHESRCLNEWHWNGVSWRKFDVPSQLPRCCAKHAVFDTRRNVLCVWFQNEENSELWEHARGVWKRAASGDLGLPIEGCVFDFNVKKVLLFHEKVNSPDNETQLSSASTWDGASIATTPISILTIDWYRPCFAYDRIRERTVVFSRSDYPDGGVLWEFDGHTWSKHILRNCPWGWSCESFSYLGALNRCVLFGGGAPLASDQIFVSEHWQWDGKTWEACQFPIAPPGRSLALMAEDTDRGCLVLFGGVAYRRQYCDTWEYGPDRP